MSERKNGRKLVLQFLREHPEFEVHGLLQYLINNGLSSVTAYTWVSRLKHEGYIELVEAKGLRERHYRVVKDIEPPPENE